MWSPTYDVDELCIGFKGRHKCKCYNKDKPNKWRFKAFCVNDSVTGYLFDFYLYGGKNADKHGDVLCEIIWILYPFIKLVLENEVFNHKGYCFSTENWYTSITIVRRKMAMGDFFSYVACLHGECSYSVQSWETKFNKKWWQLFTDSVHSKCLSLMEIKINHLANCRSQKNCSTVDIRRTPNHVPVIRTTAANNNGVRTNIRGGCLRSTCTTRKDDGKGKHLQFCFQCNGTLCMPTELTEKT